MIYLARILGQPLPVIAAFDGVELDAAISQAREAEWTTVHELLASLTELVSEHFRAFLQVNSKPGTQMPPPLRIPRPSDPPPAKIGLEDLARMMMRR